MLTKTYIKKIQKEAFIVCYKDYDIQPVEWIEDTITVQNPPSGLLVNFNSSILTSNLKDKGQGIPSPYRVLIDTLPEKDFLTYSGGRIEGRKILTIPEFNTLVFNPTRVGLNYTSFKVRLLANNALTDEWSSELEISIDIIGVLSWETTI